MRVCVRMCVFVFMCAYRCVCLCMFYDRVSVLVSLWGYILGWLFVEMRVTVCAWVHVCVFHGVSEFVIPQICCVIAY